MVGDNLMGKDIKRTSLHVTQGDYWGRDGTFCCEGTK
jgi:hypothetical protein